MARRRETVQTAEMGGETTLARAHQRFGWTVLFISLLFGTALEGLLGFKVEELLLNPVRREFWSLAHFHGAMLAILNLVYLPWADRASLDAGQRQRASRALLLGSALLPLGFFLGGAMHTEGDPGIGIFLVPVGALFLLYAIGVQALAAWKD
jgi:hypothetical protein